MGQRDREQKKDRGNTDVDHDERGRGQEVGREQFEDTRDKAEGDRESVRDLPGAEGTDDMGGERDERRKPR